MNRLKRTTNWLKNNFLNILVLGLSLFCLFNIIDKLDDSFTVVTNFLAIFATIWYFVSFEKKIINKVIIKLSNPPLINFPESLKLKKINIFPRLFMFLRRYLAIGFRFLYKERWEITSYLFVLLLLIITLGQFDFLKKFIDLSWVEKYQTIIIVLAVASGGLTMWHNRKKVETEIEEEKNKEESAEQKRSAEFCSKYPKIYKIPILKNIVKWMYKEGWAFSVPFVLIVIIFITIKIGLPLIYNGSFIDEYYHILSGIEFFKSGHFAELNSGELYNRGAYVSVLVGLFFKLFGQTIFVAKMVPAFLGIINFFLLFNISKKKFLSKKYTLLILAIYTIIPWFIFNHFYIRMYVFYESFILALTWFFLLIIQTFNKFNRFIIYLISILLISLITYFFSYDSGKYPILLYSVFLLAYLYFFKFQKLLTNKNIFKNNFLKIFIFIFILTVAYLINSQEILTLFIQANITHLPNGPGYNNLFFNLNLTFSIFFLLSFFLLFIKNIGGATKTLIASSLLLFTIHLLSPKNFQMTRAIIYLLSIFYLIAIFSLSKYLSTSKIKINLFLLFCIFLNIYENYPKNFLLAPYIPEEVNYIDNEIYKDILENCKDHLIITAGYPGVAIFQGIQPDYFLNTQIEKQPKSYKTEGKNTYIEVYSKIPIITNGGDFIKILNSEEKVCLFGGEFPDNNIGKAVFSIIQSKMQPFNKDYLSSRKTLFYIKSQ